MKKIIATLLSLSVVLALASCGGDTTTSSTASTASTAPTSSAVSTPDAPTPSPVESKPEVADPNKALSGTAITCGNNAQYGDGESALNDGNVTTRWQAPDIEGGETEDNPSWFGIKWDEAQTFDSMYILWEQAHPAKDGFRIEISEDGETWTSVDFESVRGGNPDDKLADGLASDKQHDTITLDEAVTTKYVRVVCFTAYVAPEGHEYAGETKSPTSAYEFEIYNSAEQTETTESVEAAE